jgi:hypothetical protein
MKCAVLGESRTGGCHYHHLSVIQLVSIAEIDCRLMLRCDRLAGKLLDCFFRTVERSLARSVEQVRGGKDLHITQSNHANRLPNTKTDTRSNTTIQSPDTIGVVDIAQSLAYGQVLRSVGI